LIILTLIPVAFVNACITGPYSVLLISIHVANLTVVPLRVAGFCVEEVPEPDEEAVPSGLELPVPLAVSPPPPGTELSVLSVPSSLLSSTTVPSVPFTASEFASVSELQPAKTASMYII